MHREASAWPAWSQRPFERLGLAAVSGLAVTAGRLVGGVERLMLRTPDGCSTWTERTLVRNFHRSWWPSLPLRIGLVEAGPWADDLIRQSEPAVNWFSVPAGNQQSLCGSYALDAVVRCTPEGGLEMTTAVAVGREATLDDWAATLPISYSAVFPALLDTERVTLPEDWKHSPALAMSLFVAAATQSRSLHRLGLRDVARGRRAFCPPTTR